MNKLFVTTVLLICYSFISFAQQSLPINMPTPTAASLGRYGDVKVSHYNGMADINVPIYKINERGVELNLQLNYNSSGVMVNSLPGWVGENWTLSAGGVITRVINGNPDEYVYPQQAQIAEFHNYFEGHYRPVEYTHGNISMLLYDAHYRRYDPEPDMFYFNFMGKTGKFFLGNDGEWKVVSDDNLDILFNVSDDANYSRPFIQNYPYNGGEDKLQPKTIYGFKIRDTEGNVYTFGYNISAIEYFTHFESMSDLEYIDSWLANAWYLTKVEDRLGNKLYGLNYERGPFTCQWTHFGETTSWDEEGQLASNHSGYSSYSNIQDPTREYSGQLNSPTYLSEITTLSGLKLHFYSTENRISMRDMYPNMYAESGSAGNFYTRFRDYHCERYNERDKAWIYLTSDYSQYLPQNWSQHPLDVLALTRTKQLNSIYIDKTHSDSRIDTRTFRFKYNEDDTRMHLEEFCISNSGGHTLQSYKFKYNQYQQLPHDYLTKAVDHWGYYNGNPYTLPSLLNASVVNQFYNGRNPDTTKVKYGTLEKIIYPTGGACLIEYEPNDFSQCQSLDRQSMKDSIGIGGGVRVKSIAEYEDSTCSTLLSKKSYSYLIPGTNKSSGQLFTRPMYYWKDWEARVMGESATSKLTTFRSSSIVPLSNSFGSPLGYSFVTESQLDGSKTVFRFRNISDSPHDNLETITNVNTSAPSPFDKYSERGYTRGKLLTTTMFDSQGQKVKSSEVKYRGESVESYYTCASSLVFRKNYKAPGTVDIFDVQTQQFVFFPGRTYKIYHRRYFPYEQLDSIFYSDGRRQVTKTEFSWNISNMNFVYPYQHVAEIRLPHQEKITRGQNCAIQTYSYPTTSADTCLSKMALKHCYFKPDIVKQYRNDRFVEGKQMRYEWARSKFVMPKESLILLPQDTVSELFYYGYTATGMPNGFIDKNGLMSGVVWGNKDNLPVVIFTGNYRGGEPDAPDEAVYDPIKNLQLLDTYRTISTFYPIYYSYDRLGNVRSITSNNGVSTYYDYDRFMLWLTSILDDQHQVQKSYHYNIRK